MKAKDIESVIEARKSIKRVVVSIRDDLNASKTDVQISFELNQMQLRIKQLMNSLGKPQ